MSTGFEQLEHELLEAERRLEHSGERPTARSTFTRVRRVPLAPVFAVLATVVVAAAAILLVHHGQTGLRDGEVGRSQREKDRLSTGSLLSQFGVLRRPQTARDRDLPETIKLQLSHPPLHRMLLPGLTRVLTPLPDRTHATSHSRPPGGGPPAATASGRVHVFIFAQGPSESRPTKITLMATTISSDGAGAGVFNPYIPRQLSPQVDDGYALQLVPDAVTRVKWTFATKTVYPTIKDNVAIAPTPTSSGAANIKSVTWYGATGQVIAHENHAS